MEHVRFIYLYIMIHDNFPVEDDLTIFYWKKDTFSLLTTPYIRPQTLVSCGSHGETARYGNFALDIPLARGIAKFQGWNGTFGITKDHPWCIEIL